jgi:hypothetical protein
LAGALETVNMSLLFQVQSQYLTGKWRLCSSIEANEFKDLGDFGPLLSGAGDGIEKCLKNSGFQPFFGMWFFKIPPIIPPNAPAVGER